MSDRRNIDPADVMDAEAYSRVRKDHRAEMIALKKKRRLPVGPNAMLHFECYETMLYQVHEMVYTERGGDEQVKDELAAYNPLVPKGDEVVATFMLEFEDPVIRARELMKLAGIENRLSLEFDGEVVKAEPEMEVERTTEEGKTSSIHFLHFKMTPDQASRFKEPGTRVVVAVSHPDYGHMAVMPEETREELSRDLD